MQYLDSTLIVFAVLIAVAVAAVAFEPANVMEKWQKLTESYGTHDRPREFDFIGQSVLFGGQRGGLKPLTNFVSFSATMDDYGLWLVCNGLESPEVPDAVRIPGTHIRFAGKRGRTYRFDLFAEPPVRIAVRGEFGETLYQKSRPA